MICIFFSIYPPGDLRPYLFSVSFYGVQRYFPHSSPVSVHNQRGSSLALKSISKQTVSCKSLLFHHSSLQLVPLFTVLWEWSIRGQGIFLEEIWYSPGMFRLRNLDLGFESRISDLATKYKIQNQISTFIVEIQPQGGFQLRYPELDFMDFLLYHLIGKCEKGFVKLFSGTLVFFYLLCMCVLDCCS